MRPLKAFFKDIISKPPALFPWVALFHVLMLVYSVFIFSDEPFPSLGWLQPLWLLGFTVCWLYVCDLRKWAAYGYILLTCANMIIYFVLLHSPDRDFYTSSFPFIYAFFAFFILYSPDDGFEYLRVAVEPCYAFLSVS